MICCSLLAWARGGRGQERGRERREEGGGEREGEGRGRGRREGERREVEMGGGECTVLSTVQCC